MISYMTLYMISHHLPNASILDGSVTVQEFSTRLLDTSTNNGCTPDRIHLVAVVGPVQLFLWTLAGGTFHSRAEISCCNLQSIQADDVPES